MVRPVLLLSNKRCKPSYNSFREMNQSQMSMLSPGAQQNDNDIKAMNVIQKNENSNNAAMVSFKRNFFYFLMSIKLFGLSHMFFTIISLIKHSLIILNHIYKIQKKFLMMNNTLFHLSAVKLVKKVFIFSI